MNFTNLDIAQLAMYVDIDGMEPEDAAALWLADNCARWTGWASADQSICPEAPAEEEASIAELDVTGDGQIVIGVAVAGPADDGAYFQAVVDGAKEFSAANGWGEPIVIDEITPAQAATELTNLAEQNVDIIVVGSSEISEPLFDLAEKYSEKFWYCRCGAGWEPTEYVAGSNDNSTAIEWIAGVATGIQLRDTGGDSVVMLGASAAPFEVETELAFRLGLEYVDPSFTLTYVPTGAYPYDFDNVAGATEAFNVAVDSGADAIYPYLGGAHNAIVQLANERDVIVMSAGASDVCEREGDLSWDIAIRFDGGDYVRAIFPLIASGEVTEGMTFQFNVYPGSVAGAHICNPTEAQEAELEAALEYVATDALAGAFGEIQGIAYGG
jgi:basic membrane protein A